MDYGNVFGVATGNGIEQTKFTDSECSNDSRDAFDSSVAICCIASIELVAVADPSEADFWDVVECYLCE